MAQVDSTVERNGKPQLAVIKQVQRDTFGDDVLHVDLKAIQPDRPVVVPIELTVKGVAQGVKDGGLFKSALRRILLSGTARRRTCIARGSRFLT